MARTAPRRSAHEPAAQHATPAVRALLGVLGSLLVIAGCAHPGATQTPEAGPADRQPAAALANRQPAAAAAPDTSPASTATTPPTGQAVSAPLPTLGAADVALQSTMPGLFGADGLHATIAGDAVSVWTQGSCAGLLNAVHGGQWAITVVHHPTSKDQRSWVAVLSKGDARALLVVNGGANGCSGRIVHDSAVPVTASGAARADGRGRYLALLCQAEWDGTPSETSPKPVPAQEFVIGLYTSGGQHFLVDGELATKPGTYAFHGSDIVQADGDGDGGLDVVLLPATPDPLPAVITSLAEMLYPLDLTDDDSDAMEQLFASHPDYGGGPKAAERITIASASPLAGSFTATGLVDQQHPSRATVSLSAPLRCDG